MNLYAVTIAGKEESTGAPTVVSVIKLWQESKMEAWKDVINGLGDTVESLKPELEKVKASAMEKKDVEEFILAVENNNDVDIMVWDMAVSADQSKINREEKCCEESCEEEGCTT
jgi:hypothetical protein